MNLAKLFSPKYIQHRNYCKLLGAFEHDFYEHHVITNPLQRTLLTAGSALISLFNPYRGDMIACLAETTGDSAARYILSKMLESKEGVEILSEKPRINTKTVNVDNLSKLPDGTLGKTYSNFLKKNGVTPDSRLPVQFIDNMEIAYVIQRYREVHDLIHTVLQMPTHMLGEVTVKWVEAIQFKLPMCVGAAIFGPIRLKPKHRQMYLRYYLPWAQETGRSADFLLNVYFENRWEQPLDEFYKEVNIKPLVIEKR